VKSVFRTDKFSITVLVFICTTISMIWPDSEPCV